MTDRTQLRVGDLISIPEVELVIQLAETRDLDPDDLASRATLESLTQSFVITEDIRMIMTSVFGSIAANQGRGFFIAGGYGSGKSHLLSVVALALRHPWAWPALTQQFPELEAFRQKIMTVHPLVVLIPLTEFSSSMSLEDITWSSIEVSSALSGIPLALSHSRRFLALFNRYIIPVHHAEFDHFMRSYPDEISWDRLCRDDPASAHTVALQFLEDTSLEFPFRPSADRSTILDELVQSLKAESTTGIVIIYDELSEFLKSKQDASALNEDARFLQYLGEASDREPIWIVSALQEALDRTGAIQESIYRKIADRYEKPFRLGSRHLHDLISKRLIQKKGPAAQERIRKLFESYRHSFRRIDITAGDFESIYPVHPETLDFLSKNLELFSQNRGIVAFITTRIAGKPDRGIRGILDMPAETLLTPDSIFDHFEDRILASVEYGKYHRLYRDHFLDRIDVLYPDPIDREVATRLIKILVLQASTPIIQPRTGRELANILLYKAFDDTLSQGQLNYTYFYEHFLDRLYREAGHIRRSGGPAAGDLLFTLEAGEDLLEYVNRKKTRLAAGLTAFGSTVLHTIFEAMSHGRFPLAVFHKRNALRDGIKWECTPRRILVRLDRFSEVSGSLLSELNQGIDACEYDLILWLGSLSDFTTQKLTAQKFLSSVDTRLADAWCFCIPHDILDSAFQQRMIEFHALHKLVTDDEIVHHENAAELTSRIRHQIERLASELFPAIIAGYLNGTLITAKGSVDLNGAQPDHFDSWLASVIHTQLAVRYPLHHHVAPRTEISGKFMLETLFERLIKPGHTGDLSSTRDEAFEAMVRLIAVPIGIAVRDGNTFKLSGSVRKSPIMTLISELIPVGLQPVLGFSDDSIPLEVLWRKMAAPPHGMSRPVFDLMLASLVRKGQLLLSSNNHPISVDDVKFPLNLKQFRVRHGHLLPVVFRPYAARLYKFLFNRTLGDFDADRQEELWDKVLQIKPRWDSILRGFDTLFRNLVEQYRGDHYDTRRIDAMMEEMEGMIASIDESRSAIDGLTEVFSKFESPEELEVVLSGLKRFSHFIRMGSVEYQQIRSYVSDVRFTNAIAHAPEQLGILRDELEMLLRLTDDLFLGTSINGIIHSFQSLRSAYISVYAHAHAEWVLEKRSRPETSLIHCPEWRLLELFGQFIPSLVLPSLSGMRRWVARDTGDTCRRDPSRELENSPVCGCGFELTEERRLDSPDQLMLAIRTDLKNALNVLKSIEIKDDQVIETEVGMLIEKVRSIEIGSESDLLALLDSCVPDTLIRCSQIMTTAKHYRLKHLKELTDQFHNRLMSKSDAIRLMKDWLDPDQSVSDTDMIRFE